MYFDINLKLLSWNYTQKINCQNIRNSKNWVFDELNEIEIKFCSNNRPKVTNLKVSPKPIIESGLGDFFKVFSILAIISTFCSQNCKNCDEPQCNLNLVTTCDIATFLLRPFFNLLHKIIWFSDILWFTDSFCGDEECH